MKFRFLETGKNTAYLNMSIDEVMLDSSLPVIRFYQWEPPAISIGFSQKMKDEINLVECKKRGIDCVRRLTGGKAVFHHKELTYSIILPSKLMPLSVIESYKVIANGILLGFKEMGIDAIMNENIENTKGNSICFNEPSYYEILVKGKKIVGSAQVRKKGKILQHGSILIGVDVNLLCSLFNGCNEEIINRTRLRITSISDTLKRDINYKEVSDAMVKGFEKNFKCNLTPDKISEEEFVSAKKLAEEKYSKPEWSFLR